MTVSKSLNTYCFFRDKAELFHGLTDDVDMANDYYNDWSMDVCTSEEPESEFGQSSEKTWSYLRAFASDAN